MILTIRIKKAYNSIPLAVKASLWFIFCSVLQKCIAVITTPIFTRLMTTEQYGQFNVYNSWLQIVTLVTTLRLNGAVFNKGMSLYKDDRGTYTSTMQLITFGLSTVAFILYLLFKNIISNLIELPTFIVGAMFAELMFTPAIDFWTVRKRYEYIYKPVVIRTLLMALLNAIVGVVAVLFSSEKGYARIISCVTINILFGIYIFIINFKDSKKPFDISYAKFAIAFNLPLMLHYVSQYILEQFDRIMIQKMVSIAAAGIYGVAYSIGLLLRIVTTSVNNALVPWQYDKLEKKEFKKLDDTMFSILIIIAAVSLILSCLAPEIMKLLADKKYYEGVYVIPPVSLGLFFSFFYTIYANIEFFYSKNKFSMYISMSGAALNIILNYFGIKFFGYIAAAYTTLICYAFFSIGHFIYTRSIIVHECNYKLNAHKMIIVSVLLLIFDVMFTFVYDIILIRYLLILLIIMFAFVFRKRIKEAMVTIQEK